MKKIFNLFFYYLLILSGLIITSWIIWSRFIRERTIRDIPDSLFTEYRFWILLYICFLYLYVIKNFFKLKNENIVIREILNIIYKPLITLDHFIKYNKYMKPYYYKAMIKVTSFVCVLDMHLYQVQIFIYLMQIIPRIILVTFLLLDTFYFQKLEIFYKIILIGLLPFIWRYIKYSLKDIYEQWILELESKYLKVNIYEEGYKDDHNRKSKTNAIYHGETKTIREYIEIKFENIMEYYDDKIIYKYNAFPIGSDDYLRQYVFEKYESNKGKYKYNSSPYTEEFFRVNEYEKVKSFYTQEILQRDFDVFMSEKHIFDKYKPFINNENSQELTYNEFKQITSKDYALLDQLYYDLIPSIINLKLFFVGLEMVDTTKIIYWSKVVIFSLYFICWTYILIISYYTYPVELIMGKYFLLNFLRYLCMLENPFAELYWGSLNKNLVTIENVKYIIKEIIKRFFNEKE